MLRASLVSLVLAVVTGVSLGATQVAAAHDSLAPPGASHTWLPEEDWIAYHWVPFDEQALKRALGLQERALAGYLYDDHHTLAELAMRRGLDVQALADQLIAPWRGRADEQRLAVLRDRTLRLLTQGHLAQHVFFHIFHNGGASGRLAEQLSTSTATVHAQRARGLTLAQIARRHGVAPDALRSRLEDLFRDRERQGVDLGVASRSESARIRARQLAALPCWLRRREPAQDPGNPYGKAVLQHGEHRAGWPALGRDRRRDEAGVERVRRSLTRSCWRPPPPWNWTTHELHAAPTAPPPAPRRRASQTSTLCRVD